MRLRIAYDGWPLVHAPLSPAGLHLLALMQNLPEEVQPLLLLPGEAPPWLPPHLATRSTPAPETDYGRLRWSQHLAPRLARESETRLLHLVTPQPPLFIATPTILSPATYRQGSAPAGGRPGCGGRQAARTPCAACSCSR